MSTLRSSAGRARALIQHRGPADPDAQSAARDHAAASLAAHIEKVVSEAPPLTNAQRDRLAELIQANATGVTTDPQRPVANR